MLALGHWLGERFRIVLDGARLSSDLDPLPMRVIHREEERAVVLGEVAGRDVLPIADAVCKAKRLVIQNANEALWSALMGGTGKETASFVTPTFPLSAAANSPSLKIFPRRSRQHISCFGECLGFTRARPKEPQAGKFVARSHPERIIEWQ
jgi:hypothetical protein